MVKAATGHDPLLRRPFSVFEILRDASRHADRHSRCSTSASASSTALLYDARPGERVACLGPLGRPFTLVDPPTEAWMVAGGVGLAPFATLAEALRARGVSTTLFYGARSGGGAVLSRSLPRPGRRAGAHDRGRQRAASAAASSRRSTARSPHAAADRAGDDLRLRPGRHARGDARRPPRATAGRARCRSSASWAAAWAAATAASCRCATSDGGFHHVRSCLAGPVLAGRSDRVGLMRRPWISPFASAR